MEQVQPWTFLKLLKPILQQELHKREPLLACLSAHIIVVSTHSAIIISIEILIFI